jgi:hypothetical protein
VEQSQKDVPTSRDLMVRFLLLLPCRAAGSVKETPQLVLVSQFVQPALIDALRDVVNMRTKQLVWSSETAIQAVKQRLCPGADPTYDDAVRYVCIRL